MLINAAIDTGLLTLFFFIAGMIKPKWPLFFLKKPDRFMILIISTVLFMITFTLFGEGNRQKALDEKTSKETVSVPSSVPDLPATQPNAPKI